MKPWIHTQPISPWDAMFSSYTGKPPFGSSLRLSTLQRYGELARQQSISYFLVCFGLISFKLGILISIFVEELGNASFFVQGYCS